MPKWSKQLRVTMGKLRDTPAGQLSSRVTIANHCESLQKFWKISAKKRLQQSSSGSCWTGTKVWFSVIRFERSFGFQGEKVLRGRLYHQIISGVFWFSKTQKKKTNSLPGWDRNDMGCLRLGSKWPIAPIVEPRSSKGGAPFVNVFACFRCRHKSSSIW